MHYKKPMIIGRIMVIFVATVLFFDGLAQVLSPPPIVQALRHVGFAPEAAPVIGAITISCAILLGLSQTSVLGAILVTGFLGGAISVHLRIGEFGSAAQLLSVALGITIWCGLCLSNPRVRSLAFYTPIVRTSNPG